MECAKWIRDNDVFPTDKMDIDPFLNITNPEFLNFVLKNGTVEEAGTATFLQNLRSYYNLWNSNKQITIPNPNTTTPLHTNPTNPTNPTTH